LIEIRRLVDALVVAFPDAALLAHDPSAAERMDTTPYDHVAADLIAHARALSDAIAALDDRKASPRPHGRGVAACRSSPAGISRPTLAA